LQVAHVKFAQKVMRGWNGGGNSLIAQHKKLRRREKRGAQRDRRRDQTVFARQLPPNSRRFCFAQK